MRSNESDCDCDHWKSIAETLGEELRAAVAERGVAGRIRSDHREQMGTLEAKCKELYGVVGHLELERARLQEQLEASRIRCQWAERLATHLRLRLRDAWKDTVVLKSGIKKLSAGKY